MQQPLFGNRSPLACGKLGVHKEPLACWALCCTFVFTVNTEGLARSLLYAGHCTLSATRTQKTGHAGRPTSSSINSAWVAIWEDMVAEVERASMKLQVGRSDEGGIVKSDCPICLCTDKGNCSFS
eukprot:1158517-Pelagomonas_calceolata.AAC.9